MTGPPRPVVALPGTFCAPAVFDRVRRALTGRFGLDVPSWMTDAPAWTLDDVAAWVADRIVAQGAAPVLLVGHSTGGAIALRLALTRPELVRGLMLVDSGPNMHRHGDVTALIDTLERDGTGDVVRAVVDRSFHRPPDPEDRRRLIGYGARVPLRAALEVLRSQHATDLAPVLPEVRVPVAVVHGRHDPVRRVAEARALACGVPDGRLYLVDAGHTPMYEAPGAVVAALEELDRRATGG